MATEIDDAVLTEANDYDQHEVCSFLARIRERVGRGDLLEWLSLYRRQQ